jgi:Ca2+-binding RTX toxin-like protein
VLDGKAGVDVLLGGGGNDTLQDTNGTSASGSSAFDGGTGNDVLKGTTAADLLAGGRGDESLTMGGGTNVICFDRGDGHDTVNAPTSGAGSGERNDTLSLGGVGFGQMQLSRDTSDLLVKVAGTTDVLRIKSWYLGSANQTISRLQVVVDTTPDFAPGTGDVLRSGRLCVLDFVSLVNAFDAARAANPTLVNWTPSDIQLAAARLGSSDSAAIGGTLAYRYATEGTLAQAAYSPAVADLSSAGFASAAQTVSSVAPAGRPERAADRGR